MVEIGLLTPSSRGFSPRDVQVVEAIGRFRAGGYDEQIGFTVYDTLRYKRAMESLVTEEVAVVLERLAGELEPDAVVDLLEAGLEPLRDFIAALHSKLLSRSYSASASRATLTHQRTSWSSMTP